MHTELHITLAHGLITPYKIECLFASDNLDKDHMVEAWKGGIILMRERIIKSPIPGIFYRKPNPEAQPYVKEGDCIEPGTTIGLISAMKSFHEIRADSRGTIVRFLVGNEESVRVGQDLVLLLEES